MILAILAFLGVVVFFYNSQKATSVATMQNSNMPPSQHGGAHQQAPPAGVSPAMPAGLNSMPGSADGMRTVTEGVPQSCLNQQSANPADLLPNDPTANLLSAAHGQGELANINLLNGQLSGIDIARTLRNAPQLDLSHSTNNWLVHG